MKDLYDKKEGLLEFKNKRKILVENCYEFIDFFLEFSYCEIFYEIFLFLGY